MIRVGLVTTNWSVHRCGVAEYSRMLIENNPDPEIEYTPVFGPYEAYSLVPRMLSGRFDVIHFNYDSGFLGIFAPGVASRFREGGAKIVITLCDHHPRHNQDIYPFTRDFDRVIVHQITEEVVDGSAPNYRFIPIGIPVLADSSWSPNNTTIGIAGFPLPQKRTLEVAQAAAILVSETPRITGCCMVCPESQHINTHAVGMQVRNAFPQTQYITAWMPQTEVMKVLATNLVNVFPMADGKSGISSCVRMGIGTGSHMVLSRSWMFRDIWDSHYKDEFEWIEDPVSPRTIADAVLRVIDNGKRPNHILRDWNWRETAGMYADMYHSVLQKAVSA